MIALKLLPFDVNMLSANMVFAFLELALIVAVKTRLTSAEVDVTLIIVSSIAKEEFVTSLIVTVFPVER